MIIDCPDVRWDVGQVILVRFVDGLPAFHEKVKKYARMWTKYANLTFKFVSKDPSDVRISFRQGGIYDSEIGKNALKVRPPKPTMNLGFSNHTSEENIRRHVLHEFGHALGCAHEHSSPYANILWNERAAYAYYLRTEGWDKKRVFSNVLKVQRWSSIASKFDPKSIMIYDIPREITQDGFHTALNTTLSETDKRFIASQYPYPLTCNRCRTTINELKDIHFYCKYHENYLCEDCYDTSSTRRQVRNRQCSYKVENDDEGEFLKCNRCRIGLRKSCDRFFYCRYHYNYLCGACYNSSSTRRQIRQRKCSYRYGTESDDEFSDEYFDDYSEEYFYSD